METVGPILLAFAAYLVGTASPGPATLTIMITGASAGRKAALRMASGIIVGSIIWGIVATFGLSLVMAEIASLLYVLKFVGGAYLLWLAFKSFRSAMAADTPEVSGAVTEGYFRKGLLLHLTNPKAVLVWGAILTIGVTDQSAAWVAPVVLVGCSLLGVGVFSLYAIVFSTPKAMAGYVKARRPIGALCGTLFGAAGAKLLTSQA
ncbi:MAG: LysE family transporter [Alphaproteobacteria bacterium]|nr:LysE family transporter [Alphaproteobacteria bacterium]